MAAFVIAERHHPAPMLDLSLFRNPGFIGVSVATFAIAAGMFAMYPYLTLYLQNDLGYSPLIGGLCLLPSTLLSFLVPLAARRAAEQLPPRVMLSAGLLASAAGLALMHGLTVNSSWTALIPGLSLTGVGIGLANPAIAKIALGVVPPQRAGMASGISNTFRTGGLAAGVAALGAVFQHHLASSLRTQLGHPAGRLAKVTGSGRNPRAPRTSHRPNTPSSPPHATHSSPAPTRSSPSDPSSSSSDRSRPSSWFAPVISTRQTLLPPRRPDTSARIVLRPPDAIDELAQPEFAIQPPANRRTGDAHSA